LGLCVQLIQVDSHNDAWPFQCRQVQIRSNETLVFTYSSGPNMDQRFDVVGLAQKKVYQIVLALSHIVIVVS
jgi:hypothetical protein